MTKKKKKNITVFCCENSAYKAAEAIKKHPVLQSVDLVKVPCAGRIEIGQLLRYVQEGLDRILILACPIENCKYIKGNKRAVQRIRVVRTALKNAGWDEDRVKIDFVSSVDPHKMIRVIENLGE